MERESGPREVVIKKRKREGRVRGKYPQITLRKIVYELFV
jgi:hypothetical protein